MSKIVYKPHCDKCGALIEQEIRFKKTVLELPNRIYHLYASEYYTFDPYQCKNCGAIFDSAEVQIPKEEKEEYFRNEGESE